MIIKSRTFERGFIYFCLSFFLSFFFFFNFEPWSRVWEPKGAGFWREYKWKHVWNTHAEQCTKHNLYKSSDVGQTAFKRRRYSFGGKHIWVSIYDSTAVFSDSVHYEYSSSPQFRRKCFRTFQQSAFTSSLFFLCFSTGVSMSFRDLNDERLKPFLICIPFGRMLVDEGGSFCTTVSFEARYSSNAKVEWRSRWDPRWERTCIFNIWRRRGCWISRANPFVTEHSTVLEMKI